MIYALLIALIFIAGTAMLWVMIGKRALSDDDRVAKNLELLREELSTKEKLLRELAELSRGYVTKDYFDQLADQVRTAEEELRSEKGRITITEAEIEAVDVRLRELEELKRELEMSSIDAIRELELLRAQERDINQQNDGLRSQLQTSLEALDQLLDVLNTNAEAVEKLQNAKKELIEAETKMNFYQEQISILNQKYVGLKKAYDALDIEYAQLYEKQQQG